MTVLLPDAEGERRATAEERRARVVLNSVAEPGEHRMTGAVQRMGGPRVLRELLTGGLDDDLTRDLRERLGAVDPDRVLARAEAQGLRFVVPGDAEWPSAVDDLAHADTVHERGGPPIGLWVRGPLRLDELEPAVAVVGSRSNTSYGDRLAGEIAAGVARAGVTVVSGAAFGIDAAAHRGALSAGGRTVAVLACGADRVYPTAHRPLLDHLAAHGAIVSEAPPGAAPQRIRFLARNRLIAALSRVTVLVEAAGRSGALNTANWANRLNRQVAGVPGPVTSAASGGVHEQLRTGGASLVTGSDHVLELVGAIGEHYAAPPPSHTTGRDGLRVRDRQVLDAVPVARGAEADSIARVAGVDLLSVQSCLRRLQTAGLVVLDDDGWHLTAAAAT